MKAEGAKTLTRWLNTGNSMSTYTQRGRRSKLCEHATLGVRFVSMHSNILTDTTRRGFKHT